MTESKKVAIIMAIYNGQKYIKEQIESIQCQTYTNWHLYISDDGSTDNTLKIINDIKENEKRIAPLIYNKKSHGACLNFYSAIQYVKDINIQYDYYLLADQDDIWDKEKVALQVKSLQEQEQENPETPILAYSNLALMNERGELQGKTMADIHDINLRNPYDIFLNQIFIWGNTIAFNRVLMEYIHIPGDIGNQLSHDHYLAFYACAYGKVIYEHLPLVMYRRHEKNVSDLPARYTLITAICHFIRSFGSIIDKHAVNYSNVLYFAQNAPEENLLINDIISCFDEGGFAALRFIKKYKIHAGANIYNNIANRIILFTKIYKKSSEFRKSR